ncbi:MAG: TetR family transcriptional regulator [Myxococcota bacterium]
MEERAQRIVDTAVELAEQGGFEAVRLRDVAAEAGVALGTLYRRFRSKEDLLVAALEIEMTALEERLVQTPIRGTSAFERVVRFFDFATRALCRRPNLARACIRASSCGDPEVAQRVANFQKRGRRLIRTALAGDDPKTPRIAADCATTLQLVWMGSLVGWSGNLHSQADVIRHTRDAAARVLASGDA